MSRYVAVPLAYVTLKASTFNFKHVDALTVDTGGPVAQ